MKVSKMNNKIKEVIQEQALICFDKTNFATSNFLEFKLDLAISLRRNLV